MNTNARRWCNHCRCLRLNVPGTGRVKAMTKRQSIPHKGAVGDVYAQRDKTKEEGSLKCELKVEVASLIVRRESRPRLQTATTERPR